ncbi:Transmembrane amino acid transporter [Blattamonas nauphoetae]|uniref:Transmembrane amino acid transporter n=1 Tax=Blattamonas nauphoetae TaxID=2049346 RepID=A0ABQ9WRX9_9EUKA|nr:Transmembrane amino acid transporter [Blattamonas nauphoetae]
MSTVKVFLGTGILGVPFAFRQCGWLLTFLSFFFSCFFSGYSIIALQAVPSMLEVEISPTIAGITKLMYGRSGELIANAIILIFQSSCCASYILFVSNTLELLIPSIPQQLWCVFIVLLVLCFSFIRSPRIVGTLSAIANLALLLALVLIAVGITISPLEGTTELANFSNFASSIGIPLFAFGGIGALSPIVTSLNPKYSFSSLLTVALLCVLVAYLSFGSVCYAQCGNLTPNAIQSAIAADLKWVSIPASILLVFSITFTITLAAAPVFQLVSSAATLTPDAGHHPLFTFVFTSFSRLFLLCFFALPSFTPLRSHFPLVISFVGCTAGATLSFLLPIIVHLGASTSRKKVKKMIFDIIILILIIPLLIFANIGVIKSIFQVCTCQT